VRSYMDSVYTVLLAGDLQMYGHIWFKYTVLANPIQCMPQKYTNIQMCGHIRYRYTVLANSIHAGTFGIMSTIEYTQYTAQFDCVYSCLGLARTIYIYIYIYIYMVYTVGTCTRSAPLKKRVIFTLSAPIRTPLNI